MEDFKGFGKEIARGVGIGDKDSWWVRCVGWEGASGLSELKWLCW